jgi:transposase
MTTSSSSANSLDIADIRILSTSLIHEQDTIFEVESTLTTVDCAQCGRTISEGDGYDTLRKLRYLPPAGHPVYIAYRPKRFRCAYCDGHPTTLQQIKLNNANVTKPQTDEHKQGHPAQVAEQELDARMVGQDHRSAGRGRLADPERTE